MTTQITSTLSELHLHHFLKLKHLHVLVMVLQDYCRESCPVGTTKKRTRTTKGGTHLYTIVVAAAAAAVELAGTGNIDFGGTEQHHCWFDGIALLVDGIARVPDQSEHSEPWGYCLLPREHACHTC